jgi:hypothetical protein
MKRRVAARRTLSRTREDFSPAPPVASRKFQRKNSSRQPVAAPPELALRMSARAMPSRTGELKMTVRKFAFALVAGFAFALAGMASVSAETIEVVGGANGCSTTYAEFYAADGTAVGNVTMSCSHAPVQVARR